MINYQIKEINSKGIEKYKKEWNSFVEKHPEGTFFHTYYHLKFLELNEREIQSYIFLEEDKKIKGIFPLIKEKFLFLERYKSAGFIGEFSFNEVLPLIRKYFSKKAVYLILNFPNYKKEPQECDICTFILNIEEKSLEGIWIKDLNKKSRNMIRKAKKNKLSVQISNSKEELKKFYSLYINKMREFKTRPYSFASLNYLLKNYQDFYIFNVYLNEKAIAGGTIILYKNILTIPLAASNFKYLKYAPNNFLYWKMIEFGIKKNCKLISYGPSKLNDSVAKFKMSMGGKPILYEEQIVLNHCLYKILKQFYQPLSKIKKFFKGSLSF